MSGLTIRAFLFAGALPFVASCGGGTQLSPVSVAPGFFASPSAKYICGGNPGLHVIPCPAMLEPRRPHRFFYVYGSGVITAKLKKSADRVCRNGVICTIQPGTNAPAEFKVFAGPTCGKANVVIEAFGSGGHYIGNINLEVVNHDTEICTEKH